MTSRGAQESPKSDPEPQDDKRAEPRRPQDRLGPPKGPISTAQPPPWGSIWEAKTAPKPTPKR